MADITKNMSIEDEKYIDEHQYKELEKKIKKAQVREAREAEEKEYND